MTKTTTTAQLPKTSITAPLAKPGSTAQLVSNKRVRPSWAGAAICFFFVADALTEGADTWASDRNSFENFVYHVTKNKPFSRFAGRILEK